MIHDYNTCLDCAARFTSCAEAERFRGRCQPCAQENTVQTLARATADIDLALVIRLASGTPVDLTGPIQTRRVAQATIHHLRLRAWEHPDGGDLAFQLERREDRYDDGWSEPRWRSRFVVTVWRRPEAAQDAHS